MTAAELRRRCRVGPIIAAATTTTTTTTVSPYYDGAETTPTATTTTSPTTTTTTNDHSSDSGESIKEATTSLSERFDAWVVNVLVGIYKLIFGTLTFVYRIFHCLGKFIEKLLLVHPIGEAYQDEDGYLSPRSRRIAKKQGGGGEGEERTSASMEVPSLPVLLPNKDSNNASDNRDPPPFQLGLDRTALIRQREEMEYAMLPYRLSSATHNTIDYQRAFAIQSIRRSDSNYPTQQEINLPFSSAHIIMPPPENATNAAAESNFNPSNGNSAYLRPSKKRSSSSSVPPTTTVTTTPKRAKKQKHATSCSSSSSSLEDEQEEDDSTSSVSISNTSLDHSTRRRTMHGENSSSSVMRRNSRHHRRRRRSSSSSPKDQHKRSRKSSSKTPSERRSTTSSASKYGRLSVASSSSSATKTTTPHRKSASHTTTTTTTTTTTATKYKYTKLPESVSDLPPSYRQLLGQVGFSEWNRIVQPCLIVSPFDFERDSTFQKTWFAMARKHLKEHQSLSSGSSLKLFVYWYVDQTYSIVEASSFTPYDRAPSEWKQPSSATLRNKLVTGKRLRPKEKMIVEGLAVAQQEASKPVHERSHYQKKSRICRTNQTKK